MKRMSNQWVVVSMMVVSLCWSAVSVAGGGSSWSASSIVSSCVNCAKSTVRKIVSYSSHPRFKVGFASYPRSNAGYSSYPSFWSLFKGRRTGQEGLISNQAQNDHQNSGKKGANFGSYPGSSNPSHSYSARQF